MQVDGKNYGNVSSNAASTGAPVIIFALDGLAEDNEHTIVVRAAAPAYPNVCEIDRFLCVHAFIVRLHLIFSTQVYVGARSILYWYFRGSFDWLVL